MLCSLRDPLWNGRYRYGKRSDDSITDVTKHDVVAFRNSLITQVSAKTANHDLKALKMSFKSARRDGVVTEDPTEFVETVRRERTPKIKRASCPRRESNPHLRFRKPPFYPLNYGDA